MIKKKRKYYVETIGAAALKAVSTPVTEITDEVRELAKFMVADMEKFEGIGLAAPQIGRNIRLVVIDIPADSAKPPVSAGEIAMLPLMPLTLINPEILESSAETGSYNEGCLSVPAIYGDVIRPNSVRVKAMLLDGQTIDLWCNNLLARCIQHEIDHLDGITFIDRLSEAESKKVELKVKNLRREGGRNNYRKVLS